MKNKNKKQMVTMRKWAVDPEPGISKKKIKNSKHALVNSKSNNFTPAKGKNVKKKQLTPDAKRNQKLPAWVVTKINPIHKKKNKKGKQKVGSATLMTVATSELSKHKKNKNPLKDKKNADSKIGMKKFRKEKKSHLNDCAIMGHKNRNINKNNANAAKVKIKKTAPNATLIDIIKDVLKKEECISLNKLKTKVIQEYCRSTGNPQSKQLLVWYDKSLKLSDGIKIQNNIVKSRKF
ncbi:hypothetical protein FQA39_LY05667 [Lamprigera yunnana]|nr:hypothetical protein FQA39_LY05667 [Lamprigera yunnana]